jgi:cell wall-associated NlpC family hydrolase
MSRNTKYDFSAAFGKIPKDVKYVHHGRDPRVGLDCVGLILAVYRLAGLPIDKCDEPYGERDFLRKHKTERIAKRLASEFRLTDATTPDECHDGDILLMGGPGYITHAAMVVDGHIVQMAGNTHMEGRKRVSTGGLSILSLNLSLNRAWGFVVACHRHKSLWASSAEDGISFV